MRYFRSILLSAVVVAATSLTLLPQVRADMASARCDVYPRGEDKASSVSPCSFYQAQGHVVVRLEDGTEYDFLPVGDEPGNYQDAAGRPVTRELGLGDAGLVFRLPDESLFVYWQAADRGDCTKESTATWPYCTDRFDATTLLPCRVVGGEAWRSCPAGIARMEGGQASVTVTGPSGAEYTINFLSDVVNASNREVTATFEGDTWMVRAGSDEYRVPLAAIEGG